MTGAKVTSDHSAEAAALGFYYQAFYALLTLLQHESDDATVGIEKLDDVELSANGEKLLAQLKHSMSASPPPITLKSPTLWRTLKVWIDALPELTLPETTLHLVTVARMSDDETLRALTSPGASREEIAEAMAREAQRVIDERTSASMGKERLPHANRVAGCQAFLALSEIERLNLLRRILIKQDSPSIGEIEDQVARSMRIVRPSERLMVARQLIAWWDLQVVYSLCGKRQRIISRAEVQNQIMIIIGDIEQERLQPDFETVSQPEDYQPDGMLARQIRLVEGKKSDLSKAIREEWRAREQRSKWINERPSMATVIGEYDHILREHWSDLHSQMVENCVGTEDDKKSAKGLEILRWTHERAPATIRPIAEHWNAAYYVRGSYQVLAINLDVGWHPDYLALLGDEE